jgi:hypothetical protein
MENSHFYLNNIHREGARYFDDGHSEVFAERREAVSQLPLFDPNPEPAPYPYQAGVDYGAGDLRVFHCGTCGADFNDRRDGKWVNPTHCGIHPALSIINMGICEWPLRGRCTPSDCVRGMA